LPKASGEAGSVVAGFELNFRLAAIPRSGGFQAAAEPSNFIFARALGSRPAELRYGRSAVSSAYFVASK
jgi:hypothetical protein